MTKLFWHLSPKQPKDEGLAFEIEKVENIIPFPDDLEPTIYRGLLKGCIAQTDLELLAALMEGAQN